MINVPSEVQSKYELLEKKLTDMRQHNVFSSIQSVEDLRTFMQWHVFAVWDFMSLAKRLQQDFTCVTLPWMPPTEIEAARLVNEIILGEETDVMPNGQAASHFEMYLIAMQEIGASTNQINRLLTMVSNGADLADALTNLKVSPAIKNFVLTTMLVAMHGKTSEVLGSFFYGREDSIPEMFDHLLKTWNIREKDAEVFVYYLNRHIELDGDAHGPAVQKIMNNRLKGDVKAWHELFDSAIHAVDLRIALWDGLEQEINSTKAIKTTTQLHAAVA